MSRTAGISNWLDDRMNPIVVKELRQGMQSRLFIVIVNLLLVALTAICVLAVVTNPDAAVEADGGRFIYEVLQGTLFIACLVFVPMYTLIRLRSERGENGIDLFFTTTLKPKRIVQGKLFGGFTLVGMLYSICLPYMLFTYALRGHDIPSMLLSLGFGLLIAVLLLAATVVVGCWAAPKILGGFAALAWAGVLALATYGTACVAHEILDSGAQSLFREAGFYAFAAALITTAFFVFKLLESMAIGLISMPSANRAIRLRAWASVSIASLLLVLLGISYGSSCSTGRALASELWGGVFIWMFAALPLVMIVAVIAVCEPDGFSNRILLDRPGGRFAFLRPVMFVYTNGASGGLAWVLIHAAGIVAFYFAANHFIEDYFPGSHFYWDHEEVFMLFFIGLFVLNYALVGKIIMRAFFPPSAAKYTWVAGLASMVAVVTGAVIFTVAMDPSDWNESFLWKLVVPFMADLGPIETIVLLCLEVLCASIFVVTCLPQAINDFGEYKLGEPILHPDPLPRKPVPRVAIAEGAG